MNDVIPDFNSLSDALPVRGLTIDPPGSHDLDDALWLEDNIVTVCIPDLTGTIAQDSGLEQRARAQGATRYFATGNAPMLPRSLSEDRLSLLPDVDRPVFAIQMTLDDALDVTDLQIKRGTLHSQAQLTYADLAAIVSTARHAQSAFRPMLTRFVELGNAMLRKRRLRGELAYYDLRHALAVGEEGQVRRLKAHEANVGYIVVQEMMVLANRTVAEWLLRSDLPALYRNHRASLASPPRDTLMADIAQTLAHPKTFDLETTRQRLNLLLGRARYSPTVEGHFALNLPCYTHVTSPLRRYADLVNNRVIGEIIDAREARRDPIPPYSMEDLTQVGHALHTLIMEQEQRRAKHFKGLAEAEARKTIATTPSKLAALPSSDFERVLKVTLQEAEPSIAVLESVRARMQQQTLMERELLLVLYETPADNAEWNRLSKDALAYVSAHPPIAVSLLAMGVDLLGWPETRFRQGKEGVDFTCRAYQHWLHADSGQKALETELYQASTKKAAQQASAVALCHLLCNAAPPEELGGLSGQGAGKNGGALSASKAAFDRDCLQPLIDAGNYAAAVFEACARTRQRKPNLVFSKIKAAPKTANEEVVNEEVESEKTENEETQHEEVNTEVTENEEVESEKTRNEKTVSAKKQVESLWQCVGELIWNGAKLIAEATAPTKQEARNHVCQHLIMAIPSKKDQI